MKDDIYIQPEVTVFLLVLVQVSIAIVVLALIHAILLAIMGILAGFIIVYVPFFFWIRKQRMLREGRGSPK